MNICEREVYYEKNCLTKKHYKINCIIRGVVGEWEACHWESFQGGRKQLILSWDQSKTSQSSRESFWKHYYPQKVRTSIEGT